MEACDFGIHTKDDYHKTSYVRKAGLTSLSEFSEEERSFFLWRGGLKEFEASSENLPSSQSKITTNI